MGTNLLVVIIPTINLPFVCIVLMCIALLLFSVAMQSVFGSAEGPVDRIQSAEHRQGLLSCRNQWSHNRVPTGQKKPKLIF